MLLDKYFCHIYYNLGVNRCKYVQTPLCVHSVAGVDISITKVKMVVRECALHNYQDQNVKSGILRKNEKQAGAEPGQAQFKLGLAKSAVVGQMVSVESIYLIGCIH